MKTLIAKTAIDAGWVAISEFRGSSPSGALWIADVLCTKGDEKIIVEVQLSKQTNEEFIRRQGLYIESKAKALWLVSRSNKRRLKPSLALPVFGLGKIEIECEPLVEDLNRTVVDFVKAVLSGRLAWSKDQFTLFYEKGICRTCRQAISKIIGWRGSGFEDMADDPAVEGIVLSRIRDTIGNHQLKALGLCLLKSSENASNGVGRTFPYNACPHCGTLQSDRGTKGKAKENSSRGQVSCKAQIDGGGHWRILEDAT